MKRVLIGGFLSLIGSIWAMAVPFVAGSNLDVRMDNFHRGDL
ncbi:MAG: hypothetical protein ACLUAR_19945 [Pilosibacter sp.]